MAARPDRLHRRLAADYVIWADRLDEEIEGLFAAINQRRPPGGTLLRAGKWLDRGRPELLVLPVFWGLPLCTACSEDHESRGLFYIIFLSTPRPSCRRARAACAAARGG